MSSPAAISSRILIVDDEPTVVTLMGEMMRVAGHEVCEAGSVAEAKQSLLQERLDLVLVDIDLPDGSGLDLLCWVAARDLDLDVVMVTGVVDTHVALGAIRQGATDYITKPFDLEQVEIIVARALEKRRLLRENRAYRQELELLVDERTRELVTKNEEIRDLYVQLQGSFEEALEALVTALDLRDNETQGHSWRVAEYAVNVARRMGFVEPDLSAICWGAVLHDVGKIGVPDAILGKRGGLDEAEKAVMRKHPEMGHRMLQHMSSISRIGLDIVLSHHERWDGNGYPNGLEGEAIPLPARIFAAVDTFDAMTSDRPYRPALSLETTRAEIARQSGKQFDPKVAAIVLQIDDQTWQRARCRREGETSPLSERLRQALGGEKFTPLRS